MEEFAVTGIVLSAMPYREKDKLIHIFSVELGKITAILKGVSLQNAKLKFAGQPFCFGKFDLAGSGEMYVVKGVELIDAFYDLTSDFDNFMLASSMLEICSHVLKPGILAEGLFLSLIKTLQAVVYSDVPYRIGVLKFYLTLLDLLGYGLNYETCDNCGMKFVGDIKFDTNSGTFRCFSCSGGLRVDRRDFVNLKVISATDFDKLHTLKIPPSALGPAIKLILLDISERLNIKIKSVDFSQF